MTHLASALVHHVDALVLVQDDQRGVTENVVVQARHELTRTTKKQAKVREDR